MWVAFAIAKATHTFFSKNISVYVMFNDHTLINAIVSFEQLGPALHTFIGACFVSLSLSLSSLFFFFFFFFFFFL